MTAALLERLPYVVRVRTDRDRFALYMRRDGALGIWNPDTFAPATNLEVLGLDFHATSTEPYWTRGLNAAKIAGRHVDRLNAERMENK